MEKNNSLKQLVKKLGSKKAKDYTYIIVFFLIFSFFIFFAIRPSLITAFSLNKQEQELMVINSGYEQSIVKIVNIQSQMQANQDKIGLLPQALPVGPNVGKILADIKTAGEKNSMSITSLTMNKVQLSKDSQEKINTVEITLQATSSFDNLMGFLKDVSNQRRVKSVRKIDIAQNKDATGGAQLKLNLQILGYYL